MNNIDVWIGIGLLIVSIISITNSMVIYRNRTWKDCLREMEGRLNERIREIKTDLKEEIKILEERLWEEKR